MIEATLCCDFCGAVIAAESTAAAARRANGHLYRRVGGKDMCNECCKKHGYKSRKQAPRRQRDVEGWKPGA